MFGAMIKRWWMLSFFGWYKDWWNQLYAGASWHDLEAWKLEIGYQIMFFYYCLSFLLSCFCHIIFYRFLSLKTWKSDIQSLLKKLFPWLTQRWNHVEPFQVPPSLAAAVSRQLDDHNFKKVHVGSSSSSKKCVRAMEGPRVCGGVPGA